MEELKNFAPFSSLLECECAALCEITQIKMYQKNSTIFYEDDNLNSIFFLLNGAAKFYKITRLEGEVFLYRVNSGLLIAPQMGEIRAFASCEALENSLVAKISQDLLMPMLLRFPSILRLFYEAVLQRDKYYENTLKRELVFDSTAKIAHFLDTDLNTFNNIKKRDVAAFLNIQPETLSRILKKLGRENIIAQNDLGEIKIINPTALRAIYNPIMCELGVKWGKK